MEKLYLCKDMYKHTNIYIDKSGKGIRNTNRQVRSSHGDAERSTGNTVGTIMITVDGARWAPETLWGALCRVSDCLATVLYT